MISGDELLSLQSCSTLFWYTSLWRDTACGSQEGSTTKLWLKSRCPGGVKSCGYLVPSKYHCGVAGAKVLVTIQAAFIRPEWVLIFLDHNSMITFHVTRIKATLGLELKPTPGTEVRLSVSNITSHKRSDGCTAVVEAGME